MKKDAENTTEIGNEANTMLCPVLGQTYFYFDDGKITESRKDEVLITEIISFEKIDKETKQMWEDEVVECSSWGLYDKITDFFVKGKLKDGNHELTFVRSKGGWFSFGNYMWDGRLDIDGSLNALLNGA